MLPVTAQHNRMHSTAPTDTVIMCRVCGATPCGIPLPVVYYWLYAYAHEGLQHALSLLRMHCYSVGPEHRNGIVIPLMY